MFNGQPLDYGPVTGELGKSRPHTIPADNSARFAAYLSASGTGSAVFTRLAFGKCVAWPESITNCQQVKEWLRVRSKQNSTTEGAGAGTFGMYNNHFTVKCLGESEYFMWRME